MRVSANMAESEKDSQRNAEEENILYDLTIHAEWPQEAETINRAIKEKSQVSIAGRVTSTAQRSAWTLLRSLGYAGKGSSPCILPAGLMKLISCQIHWHLAVSSDGKEVAILQDTCIEVRSSRDEYSTMIGRCMVNKDPYPQWRRLCWSKYSDMLACSDSSGNVQIFDLVGTWLCTIPSPAGNNQNPTVPVDLSRAIASLIFTDFMGDDEKWSRELLVINFQGCLKSYLVSREGRYEEQHCFQFSKYYPRGISCVLHSPAHSLLMVGGAGELDLENLDSPSALQCGISAWRILSDYPYYKLVTDYEEDMRLAHGKISLVKKLKNMRLNWSQDTQDGVYKMCLTPSGNALATLHYSGSLGLWEMPSLRKRKFWEMAEQPGYDEINPSFSESPWRRKQMKDFIQSYNLNDINWWSDEAIILARCSGALTLSSSKTLKNLLGVSPEWFEPAPLVTPANDGSFVGLECESKLTSLKRRHAEDEKEEFEMESDDEDDATYVTKTTRYVKSWLYFFTDFERFQPPRKRPKVMNKTYRLVCLKSTTPEELYARKIDNEEYGEALLLAKAYGLDCDMVYQRQWRKSPVSVASIQDYLSKISKRSWVLHECMERVPEDIDAMRELLQYGLRGTDLEALIAIGKGEDGGRFILCDQEVMEDINPPIDEFDEEAVARKQEEERCQRQQLLEQVTFTDLTLEQKELCRARMKLLQYLDRLSTYEVILGGIHQAEELFDGKFFEKFRSQNIVELSVDYARAGDWRALDAVFTYHGEDVLPHRCAILANFPETFSPFEFRELLPEAGVQDGDPDVLPWLTQEWRPKDWCEMQECRQVVDPVPVVLGAFLYEEFPEYERFDTAELSKDQLVDWYQHRACEIERLSRQVDHALELVNLGMERGVPGLEELHDDLTTMETLVYECYLEDNVTFKSFRDMSDLEKLQLMMDKSAEEMYVKNLRRWMTPFLHRCEKRKAGSYLALIREYLVTLAKDDLVPCVKIFENSKADVSNPVIANENQLMAICLECLYVCERDDQLSEAFAAIECLPQRGYGIISEESSKLHSQVDELEKQLSAAEILESNGLPKTISYIKASQDDVEESKSLFTKLTRTAGRKTPALGEMQWRKLLSDLLDLQRKVYKCVEPAICYEIFVESLLCSSRHDNIQLAGKMMRRSVNEEVTARPSALPSDTKVGYDKSVDLVLTAAREYFNSSADLKDSCMELARSCLTLIEDTSSQIQQELDLISSLAILDFFGVTILPLQVRLCKDRLELVHKAMQTRSSAYKNAQKLLKLGHLLRVPAQSSKVMEGKVLRLVAQAALENNDYKVAQETCDRLMADGYAPIWAECKLLAEQEDFQDIRSKSELLSFAVTHCTPDMIEPILKAKCLLDIKILYDTVNAQVESSATSPRQSPFTAAGALAQTKEILSTTSKTTKAVLSTVTNARWWGDTLKSLHPLRMRSSVLLDNLDDRNYKFETQGCHPFYESVIEDCYPNQSAANYRGYRISRDTLAVRLSESLLRTAKLEETLTEGATLHSSSEVIIQLARDCINVDSTLGLAYLLALPEVFEAEECFIEQPSTSVSLQFAAYYYALQLYTRLQPQSQPSCSAIYTQTPETVIQAVSEHVTNKADSDWSESVASLIEKLEHYQTKLMDLTQAHVLRGLGRGVDVGRFTQDAEYKHETILGLAMTLEDSVYEIALSLAQRYQLPVWDVYMTHLEFLFSDSGLNTSQVAQRVKTLGISDSLQSEARFPERMRQYVYPTIEGTDHSRLMYYYTLLVDCAYEGDSISPAQHVALLKKIKSSAPRLDYKKLLDGKHDPIEVIRPALLGTNVSVIAKLASKIPDRNGGFLHSSVVYCAWAIKMFWEGDQSLKASPENMADWVHRYEAISEHMSKMMPAEVIQFSDGIIFVESALERLSVECREQITKRALKYCRAQGGKKKKMSDEGASVTWEDAANHIRQSGKHLANLVEEGVQDLLLSEDPQLQAYGKEFDLSRSEPDKLKQLLMRMVLDGQSPVLVSSVLDVSPVESWAAQTAVKEAIGLVVEALRTPGEANPLLEGRDCLSVMKGIVTQVGEHQHEGGDLVHQEDIVSLLRPFCGDASIAVQPRLDILQLLEQSFELKDTDLVLLIFYRTDAIVSAAWKEKKLSEVEISSDEKRQGVFESLLGESIELEQFLALSKLLQVWPNLHSIETYSDDPEKQPWCQLFSSMLTKVPSAECANTVYKLTKGMPANHALSEKCTEHTSSLLLERGFSLPAVKVLLSGGHSEHYSKATAQLAAQEEAESDEDLFTLILEKDLTVEVVSTPYYPLLVQFILDNQAVNVPLYLSVERIANQLQEAGFESEAGSLMLQKRGTHPALLTLDAALGFVSKWFKGS